MVLPRFIRPLLVVGGLLAVAVLGYGCSSMRCDGAGKGYECTSVDSPPPRHTRSPHQPPWSDEYHDIAKELPVVSDFVFMLTNEERKRLGHPPLKHDQTLSQIACWHNQDMIGHNYLGHDDSDDRSPQDRGAREHRRFIGAAAENAYERRPPVARDDSKADKRAWAEEIVTGWMNSPGHRSNILNDRWTHFGACVSKDSTDSRSTQVFASVQAYLDEPFPWAMTPGDSVSVSFTLVKAAHSPTEYEFVPAGEPLAEAFEKEGREKPLDEKLYLPKSPGEYGLRLLIPEQGGRYAVVKGPRVLVLEEGTPAYEHAL